MTLAAGSRVGPYEVLGSIGAGGMGEVYRARDPRLNRDVAIKILPALFAADPDRLARFEREAQTLAVLNHPNIAHVYGVVDGPALVMELVEGEDLAQRIARGPIPLDDVLAIAKQVVEALEAAHEQGIVHRDLKPANIKVRADGAVKVLDFGLAKAMAGEPSGVIPTLADSPTFTSPAMTQMGVILGTAAYMAPEQARGKPVDRRADIWAFGAVVYEMLARKSAFAGETVTDTMSALISREPDWNALPTSTPAYVRRLLRRCLEKDPRKRLQAIGEARLALESGDVALPVAPSASGSRALLPIAIVAALAIGAGGMWAISHDRSAHPPSSLARLEVPFAPAASVVAFNLSADASMLLFEGINGGSSVLYVRRFDRDAAVPLLEFPGATDVLAGTFSPDGKWIAYYEHGVLKKVSVDGAAPIALATSAVVGNSRPSWGAGDTIVFTNPSLGLSRVKGSGGDAQVLSNPDAKSAEMSHELPFILPGGKTVLYDVHRAAAPNNSGTDTVVAQPLDGGPRRELFPGAVLGMIGDDRLVLWRDSRVVSLPFDTQGLRATGEATPLVSEPIAVERVLFAEAALFAVAPNGTMVYAPADVNADNSPLTIVDRAGHATVLDLPRHRYADPRVSPDGERIVVHGFDEGRDNWVVDIRRGTLTRLTTDPGEDETPIWSPDGKWVYWTSTRANVTRGIFRKASDGSGNEELLWTTDAHLHLGSVTPDGGTVIFSYVDTAHRSISALRLSDKKVTPLVTTSFMNVTPVLSPDGRWIAYVSNESGRNEVYVQPYPSMQGRTQVSAAGGIEPQWSRHEHQLLYRSEGKLMAVDYSAGATFDAAPPRVAFPDVYDATQGDSHTCWDVFPDGRFIFVSKPAIASSQRPTLKILLPR